MVRHAASRGFSIGVLRMDRLQFFVDSKPVGCFRMRGYPTKPGRVRYMPYRGVGHFHLAQKLRAGESVNCWYKRKGKKTQFVITREETEAHPKFAWYVVISEIQA